MPKDQRVRVWLTPANGAKMRRIAEARRAGNIADYSVSAIVNEIVADS